MSLQYLSIYGEGMRGFSMACFWWESKGNSSALGGSEGRPVPLAHLTLSSLSSPLAGPGIFVLTHQERCSLKKHLQCQKTRSNITSHSWRNGKRITEHTAAVKTGKEDHGLMGNEATTVSSKKERESHTKWERSGRRRGHDQEAYTCRKMP